MPIFTHYLSNIKLSLFTTLFNRLAYPDIVKPVRFLWVILLILSGYRSVAQDGFFVPAFSSQARLAASELSIIDKYSVYLLKTTDLRNRMGKAPLENRVGATALRFDVPSGNGTSETFTMVDSPVTNSGN